MNQRFLSKRRNKIMMIVLLGGLTYLFFRNDKRFIISNFIYHSVYFIFFFLHTFYFLRLLFEKKKHIQYAIIVFTSIFSFALYGIWSAISSKLVKINDEFPTFLEYFQLEFGIHFISLLAVFFIFWLLSVIIYFITLSREKRNQLWNAEQTKQTFSTVLLLGVITVIFASAIQSHYSNFWAYENVGQVVGLALLLIIQTKVMWPLLLEKKHKVEFILWQIVFYLLINLVGSWLGSVQSSKAVRHIDGFKSTPFDLMVENNYIQDGFLYSFVILFPFLIVSFIIYSFSLTDEKQKSILPQINTEVLINAIIFLLISIVIIMERGYYQSNFWVFLLFCFWAALFYYNAFFLSPNLFKTKNISRYIGRLAILYFFFQLIYQIIARKSDFVGMIFWNDVFMQSIFFVLIVFLSLIYSYVRNRFDYQNLLVNRKSSELDLLKSQVNPHFLFNSLNTLYSTALEENAPSTAASTAKLANLIRYMQEDMRKEFIPLENEVQYIQDYIEFQKMRCSVEPTIEMDVRNIENKMISPGLLIPFVENAFKYGVHPAKHSVVKIDIEGSDTGLTFYCENDIYSDIKTNLQEKGFGIGISNTKERLELVYPRQYELTIEEKDNLYQVNLFIETNS